MDNGSGEPTPAATKVVLVAVLAVTAVTLATVELRDSTSGAASGIDLVLWLFTALFVLRVAGQILVAVRPQGWLPPMAQWNLLPYRILLPLQIVVMAIMVWVDVAFSRDSGTPVERSAGFGTFLIAFSGVYAGAMAVRYVVRMRRRPGQRWFGGTIPIVFHLVLASYLYVLGSFHAAS